MKHLGHTILLGFPGDSVVKNPPANNAGDVGSIPGMGRSPGGGREKAPHSSIPA